jgi:peptidoglycan/xylan/chitin deacetylase (PgdA/CDA1 family)
MYHAIPGGHHSIEGADAHYAVALARFNEHLDRVEASGRPVLDVAVVAAGAGLPKEGAVAITFDDGHASNLDAAHALAARGMVGTFFVNPSTVGTSNYLSWQTLSDMAAAGMSIQSHGFHHHFLNDLTTDQVRAELSDSRRAIEDRLGRAVTVFAPPGGRVVDGLDRFAEQAGYRVICTSEVGVWASHSGSPWRVPRFAVLAQTQTSQLVRWVEADRRELFRQRARHQVLQVAKKLLGNDRYVRWRGAVVQGGEMQ